MRVITSLNEMQKVAKHSKASGKSIGFVPTMGALHEGHLALVKSARQQADIVVVSIFVNPLQFGPKEDFKRYPRPISQDKKLLSKAGVDILFTPNPSEMYPDGESKTYVEVPELAKIFEGKIRPGHFRGVATVVAKLFAVVQPDLAIFGEKDYQQLLVIRQMTKDLHFLVKIESFPTVREENGLAMSSRNKYLSQKEQSDAKIISHALFLAKEMRLNNEKNASRIKQAARELIALKPAVSIEYLEVVNPDTLMPIKRIQGKARILVAAKIGKTRLIDNLAL